MSFLIFLISFNAFGQNLTLEKINKEVNRIQTDSTLTITVLNALDKPKETLDGGYVLKVWHQQHDIVKIVEEKGLSYGRLKTILYLNANLPIKIIEVEDNFSQTSTGLNYKKLDVVYKTVRHIVNWKQGRDITQTKGKRRFSVPKKSVHDYNTLVEKVQRTIGKP